MTKIGDRVRVIPDERYVEEYPLYAEKLMSLVGTVEDPDAPQIKVRFDEEYLPRDLSDLVGADDYEPDVFYANNVEIV